MKFTDFSIFDNFLFPVLAVTEDSRLIYTNAAFANLLGVSLKRWKSGTLLSEALGFNGEKLTQVLEHVSLTQEIRLQNATGEEITLQVCPEPIETDSGNGFLFGLQDVSVEQRLQRKYRLELQQKEIFIKKLDRKLFEVSFLLEVTTGINRQGGAQDILEWALGLIAERFHFLSTAFLQIQGQNQSQQVTVVAVSGEKQPPDFWQKIVQDHVKKNYVHISYSTVKDTTGIVAYVPSQELLSEDLELLQGVAVQIIARIERELLYSNSVTDEKTGLYNSRFLRAALQKECHRAGRENEVFGFIMIDIDHFKKFNDTYGHQTGDEVLVHVAKKVAESIRDVDVAARFGGEEFCVIAVKSNREGLLVMMERIRNNIASSKFLSKEHGPVQVTVSLGGAIFSEMINNPEALFEAADAALYDSKKAGRNKSTIR